MVVPLAPGGTADLAARPVAAALEKILERPVIVENRTGAGGSLGNASVAKAEPDGYTLLMTISSFVVLPEADRLFDRKPLYETDQFVPIARVLADPNVLAVHASSPWKTLKDFVDDAKKRPGEIAYGSSGNYGGTHVSMEIFAHAAGIKLLNEKWPPTYILVYGDAKIEDEGGDELLIKIVELMAEQPMPEKERADLRVLAKTEGRVVIRIKPESTFETPPRHVYDPEDVKTLTHWLGASLPWNSD